MLGLLLSGCKKTSNTVSSGKIKVSEVDIGDFKDEEKVDSSFFSIKSSANLFPSEAEPILLSFYFRYIEPPPIDKRQRLVTNFDSQNLPYSGWALAMTRLRTSLRLEFYLKDRDGLGGWYTLSPLDISRADNSVARWYAMSFLVLPGNFISSLYAKVNTDFTPDKNDQGYVTGVSIDSFGEISADSLFQVTSGSPKSSSLIVEIAELVIFKLRNVPNESEFLKAAKGGPRSLKANFKDSCVLALDGEGEDFCEIYAKKN